MTDTGIIPSARRTASNNDLEYQSLAFSQVSLTIKYFAKVNYLDIPIIFPGIIIDKSVLTQLQNIYNEHYIVVRVSNILYLQ